MLVIPAIDLREGACVQLVGGRYETERVRLPDPLAVARDFWRAGFRRLHVVDLDAATGRGSNEALVRRILAETEFETQVGGGIRDQTAIERWLGAGAARVVVGTRAIEDHAWLEHVAARHPARILVAADIRDGEIVVAGWTRAAGGWRDRVRALEPLPLAGLLVTAVHREGRLQGTDLDLLRDLIGVTRHPLVAAGGIANQAELERLAALGCHAAVLGMSLYTGALDARATARAFAS